MSHVYRLLRNALQAGDVFVRDSNEFRRFEDDLISDTRWAQREAVLREIGAPLLLAPIEDTLQTQRWRSHPGRCLGAASALSHSRSSRAMISQQSLNPTGLWMYPSAPSR